MISKEIFVLFFAAAASSGALAQTGVEVKNSHLNCFKGKLDRAFRFKAYVDLIANQQQEEYSLKKCRVKTSNIDLCIPSTKKILSTDSKYPSIIVDVRPQPIRNDFICYKLKCDPDFKPALPHDQPAADQFGVKYFNFGNRTKFDICVPAWKIGSDDKPIIIKF